MVRPLPGFHHVVARKSVGRGLFPEGRFYAIADTHTFIPEDQPERLASVVRGFLVVPEPADAMN